MTAAPATPTATASKSTRRQLQAASKASAAEQRLRLHAEAAIASYPTDFIRARAAFIGCICNDAAALFHLFENRIEAIAGDYLHRVAGAAARSSTKSEKVSQPRQNPNHAPRGLAAIAAAGRTVALAYLGRETELGKPLGQCSRAELEDMAARNRHRAWFYEAVGHQMPTTGVVADFFTDDSLAEIDRRWNGDMR